MGFEIVLYFGVGVKQFQVSSALLQVPDARHGLRGRLALQCTIKQIQVSPVLLPPPGFQIGLHLIQFRRESDRPCYNHFWLSSQHSSWAVRSSCAPLCLSQLYLINFLVPAVKQRLARDPECLLHRLDDYQLERAQYLCTKHFLRSFHFVRFISELFLYVSTRMTTNRRPQPAARAHVEPRSAVFSCPCQIPI